MGAALRLLGQRHDPGNNTTINQPPDGSGGSRRILATPADFIAPSKRSCTAGAQLCSGRGPAGISLQGLHRPVDAHRVLRWRRACSPAFPEASQLQGPLPQDPTTAAAQAPTPASACASGHHSTDTKLQTPHTTAQWRADPQNAPIKMTVSHLQARGLAQQRASATPTDVLGTKTGWVW